MELPLRQRDRVQLEILRRYPILESLPKESFSQLIELVRRVLRVAAVAIFIPAKDRIFLSAEEEVDSDQLALLIGRADLSDPAARILVHDELDREPRFRRHPLVAERPGFRFFAAAALRAPDDLVLGHLCLLHTGHRQLSNADFQQLLSFADMASSELELLRQAARAGALEREHPHPMWMYETASMQVVDANEAALHYYGYDREELLGLKVDDLLAPEDVRLLTEAAASGPGETARAVAVRHRTRSGETLHADVLPTPGYHAGRLASMVEVFAVPAHELRPQEAEQVDSFFRTVLRDLPIEISVLDLEGRMLFVNEATAPDRELRDWLVGKTAYDLCTRLGLDIAIAERRRQAIEAAVRDRRVVVHDEELVEAERPARYFLRIVAPVTEDDGTIGYLVSAGVDVTERRHHEDAAEVGERRLRSMFEAAGLGLVFVDGTGHVLEANPAFVALTGYERQELLEPDDVLVRLIHPDDAARTREMHAELMSGRRNLYQSEHRLIRKDGTHAWVRMTVSSVRDDVGSAVGAIALIEDVTERRRADQTILRSEQRSRLFLDAAGDAILVSRFQGPLVEANQEAVALTGYSRDELLHMHLDELVGSDRMPDGSSIWDALLTGETISMQRTLRRADGRFYTAELTLRLVENRYVIIVARDVSERQERSRRLEFEASALGQLSEAVVATDLLGRVSYMNAAAEELIGIKARDALGKHASEVLDVRLAEDEKLGRVAEDLFQRGQWRGEMQLHAAEGGQLPAETSLRLARDEEGVPFSIIALARDIRARKEHEQSLIDARDAAEEMNRLKSAFLANMSHEIRTPLTSIIGFAEVLAEEATETEREFAGLIRNSGRRLMETLNSVLDLAQLESSALKIELEPIDVAQLIHETLELFRPTAADRGLRLSFEREHNVPVLVRVDRAGLSRVLTNLVSNAIKFTQQGGVTIRMDSEDSHVHIIVSDTGIGISSAFLPRLFDEFKQESTGLTRSYEGSGLGLTITKRLVELMGGAIDVESEKGAGTTFTVTLPR